MNFLLLTDIPGKTPCCNMENLLCKRAQQLTVHNHYADFRLGSFFSNSVEEKEKEMSLKSSLKVQN